MENFYTNPNAQDLADEKAIRIFECMQNHTHNSSEYQRFKPFDIPCSNCNEM